MRGDIKEILLATLWGAMLVAVLTRADKTARLVQAFGAQWNAILKTVSGS